ncbi:hypothetical protein V6S02_07895 [Microbacterium sp. CCNWLW134]|uniref:hypothetical protein n=1 Tax=Microbacterium sp. CCNWLW134 TaxID=3122064 RepID=UPI00300FD1F5
MTTPQPSPQPDLLSLQQRILELEKANDQLRTRAGGAVGDDRPARPRAHLWRSILSAICIVLASVILPLSIAGAWVRATLVDEEQFVATMAPLIDDPAVQSLIVDEVSVAVSDRVDVTALTDDVFDGLATLDLPPRAAGAIDLLRGPAAEGLQNIIDQTITRVVASEAFADIWSGVLRAGHRALVTAGTGEGAGGAITIDQAGTVGIQLQPIIAAVKERLLERGIGLASAIPEVNRTIVVAENEALASVRVAFATATALGWILPVVTLALLIIGVLIARRRTTALLGAGVGIAAGSAAMLIGMTVGRTVLSLQPSGDLPPDAIVAIYDQVGEDIRQTAIVGVTLGVVIALFAWFQGRWRGAVATRDIIARGNTWIRTRGAEQGLRWEALTGWMDRQRVVVRAAIAALAIVWLWTLRPLDTGEILLVVIVSLLAWWIAEVLRTRADQPQTRA